MRAVVFRGYGINVWGVIKRKKAARSIRHP